jgi:ParB-like chromosome segregation protein Spo0J
MMNLKIVSVIEVWSVDRLMPYAKNPRTHSDEQIGQLVRSIRKNGFVNPVLAYQRGSVIAGHGRILAAQRIGLKELPVIVLDHLTETEVQALRVADNRITENGGWDETILQGELAALHTANVDLTSLGFAELEVKKILEELESQGEPIDEDAAPDPPAQPITRLGDLWHIPDHRLLCGDSTSDQGTRGSTRRSDLR